MTATCWPSTRSTIQSTVCARDGLRVEGVVVAFGFGRHTARAGAAPACSRRVCGTADWRARFRAAVLLPRRASATNERVTRSKGRRQTLHGRRTASTSSVPNCQRMLRLIAASVSLALFRSFCRRFAAAFASSSALCRPAALASASSTLCCNARAPACAAPTSCISAAALVCSSSTVRCKVTASACASFTSCCRVAASAAFFSSSCCSPTSRSFASWRSCRSLAILPCSS